MALAKRIIPVLLAREGNLVKGKQFDSSRVVGNALQAANIHAARGVDELVVLDVGATRFKRGPDIEFMRKLAEECHIPVAVGGGVHEVWHVKELLANGADKVIIGAEATRNPEFITECADKFGSQAITVAVNIHRSPDLTPRWHVNGYGTIRGYDALWFIKLMQARGAGELFLNCIDYDGMMKGYDLKLIAKVTEIAKVPIIICGGAGKYLDMHQALRTGADAVAAGALFQFTDATPRGAAEYLAKKGWEVRL